MKTKIKTKKIKSILTINRISLVLMSVIPIVSFFGLPLLSQAALRNFGSRYATTTTGNIIMTGNTLMSCDITVVGCAAARAGTASGAALNNNNFNMVRIDTDSDPLTNNSSTTQINIPTGSTILWAGLYVGGVSNNNARKTLKLDTPATPGYVTLTSQQDDTNGNSSTAEYQEFVDITSYVQAGQSGPYTVSGGAISAGANLYGGWGITIVYSNPSEPMRNLTVFDGFTNVGIGSSVTIPLSGFLTPAGGPVKANLGILAYEGDSGSTGDKVTLNSTEVFNTTSPSNNFFNSTITNLNNPITTPSNPIYPNTMGIDIDTVNIDGKIPPSATSASLVLSTSLDGFFPGVITTAIDVLAPKVQVDKSILDVNGSDLRIGDVVEFTLNVKSNGLDTASNVSVTDTLDPNFDYVPGSINIVSGQNVGIKTDNAGDDQANYDTLLKKISVNLGTSATAAIPGEMFVNQTAVIKFKAKVKNTVIDSQILPNSAKVFFRSNSLKTDYIVDSNVATIPVVVPPTRLTGKVYKDSNGNAILDTSELGLPSIPVNIINPITNIILATTVTNSSGDWTIELPPGNYKIDIIEPTGKTVTGTTDNNIVTAIEYTTVNAGNDGINDFTDMKLTKVSCPVFIAGTTCDYVLTVTNVGNGILNAPIKIVDTLPARLTYLTYLQGSTGSTWNCINTTPTIDCTSNVSLNPGQSSSVIIRTKLPN
jgi:fimbrial isopeptide formation D2 family protein